jgi:hypothetical protein
MKPIPPATGAPEVVFGEGQPEYLPIPVATYVPAGYPPGHPGHSLLLRYTFTDEERVAIAGGEDVYFMQLYPNGGPMTPVSARVGPGDWKVDG